MPLNLKQAVFGSKLKIKTVSGKKVQLNIPKGTRDGTVFRLTGLGIENCRSKGDQYVTVKVKIPNHPTEEEKELMKQFSEK